MGSLLLPHELSYMTRKTDTMVPDLLADPFEERSRIIVHEPLQSVGRAVPVREQ